MHPFIQNTVFPVLGVGAAVVTKKPKEMKTAWIYGRVNQASLKLYAGFPNTVCWTSNFFFANCLICLKVKKIEAYTSTFCSNNKLCINKDNPLVTLQSNTPIFVCQMRKSIKLPVRVEF